MGRYSIDTPPIQWLAMYQEFIRVEDPPMSANILIVMLLVAQKHIGQILVNYQRWYTGQLLVLYQLLVEK